ncbi:Magnesium transporter NIPA [Lasallia pustulata]|uniref:Magnesium transporter NIPA n=1 Tax=Lasallia pustulata TaxID=136370 RepID=A0A1W5D9R0_9LECA|nr:Magnesium transporter NIPA [Lasallia pustulata]
MHLPVYPTGAPSGISFESLALANIQTDGPGSKLREWSSLIGIVTAIVGNIFISFALNIQRYAHIRLHREREHGNRSGKGKTNGHNGCGTRQAKIAEERARLNLDAPAQDEGDAEHQKRYHGDPFVSESESEDDETTPLKRPSQTRSSSESTIKQSEKGNADADGKTYLSSPYWWAGILLMTVGEAGNFLAYGFAPASIVSPLGVVALVSNCIIAPCLLKERFRQRDFWGVVVAVAGAVTVVLSAKTSEPKMGPDDVWSAITRWEFELYLGITAVLIIGLIWASGKYGHKTILIDLGLVGLFGGYTALSTKGVASLFSDTLWRALTFPITYLLIFILVATALLQIRYVNKALQRFNSTQVIPTQFVLFTISVIIGSAILYRDFESATVDRVGKFVGGCALTFLGVYLITSGRGRDDGEEEDDDEELDGQQDAIDLVDEEAREDEVEGLQGDDAAARRKSMASSVFNPSATPTRSRRSSRRASSQSSRPEKARHSQSHSFSGPSMPALYVTASFAEYQLLSTVAYRGARGGQHQPTRANTTASSNAERRKTVNAHKKVYIPDDARSAGVTLIRVAQCSGGRLSPARRGYAHTNTAAHVRDEEVDLAKKHRRRIYRRRSSAK